MPRRAYTDEQKAEAVAACTAGESPADVAKQMGVPVGTVKSWASTHRADVSGVATAKKENIGVLVVGHLSRIIKTLDAQLEVYGDREWLQKQDASGAAVLYGVLNDKAYRLLSALQQGAGTIDIAVDESPDV